jgi:hypothetical protein
MRHAVRYAITLMMGLLLSVGPAFSQQDGHLQPGSDPSVLPGPVLIADEDNDRIVLVDPQGRITWMFPEPGSRGLGQISVRDFVERSWARMNKHRAADVPETD